MEENGKTLDFRLLAAAIAIILLVLGSMYVGAYYTCQRSKGVFLKNGLCKELEIIKVCEFEGKYYTYKDPTEELLNLT